VQPVEQAGGIQALIFDIRRYSVHDGPGIRTTVFFKGCPLSCWWCHNPESRGRNPFVHYDPERCLGCGACVDACRAGALSLTPSGVATDAARCSLEGACVAACPAEARRMVGRRYTVADVLAEVERDRLFHEQSAGGVTFSGGEPLQQWRFLTAVLGACGDRGIHRAVDTTGFAAPDVLARVAERTDLFLYDLKTMDPTVHRDTTGVPLQPILDNLVRLASLGAAIRIRVPVIRGISDSDDNIDRVGAYVADLPGVEAIHLLPFHRPAKHKHARFGTPWRMEEDGDVPDGRVAELSARLERFGLPVTIGG
jgi:pyruvate formate lyase activating enzyme